MQKKWLLKQNDLSAAENFSEINAPDFIKNILINRGIKTKEEAEKFLNPDYNKLLNPFLMLNMERGARRIISAIHNNEKIVIYGDYDADGICGAAVFYSFFKALNYENFEVYIPNRYEDGYGLNFSALDEFAEKKINLIITVDCGICDIEETKKARKFGIDVIITDHHLPQDTIPDAVAVIDPHQKNDDYEFKELCGAGVAFKVVSAVLKIENFGLSENWEKWLLDLVALATVADMSSLKDENRILTYYGIKVLKKTRRLGLQSLLKKAKVSVETLNTEDIAYFIAPRLNAASRVAHANTSFSLIAAETISEAEEMAASLEEKNNERKKMVEAVTNEAREKIDTAAEIIILGNEAWSAGILGAAASRLIEEFNKPIFLWGKGDAKEIKGSSRSNGVDLVELMKNIDAGIFLDFGGHKLAAGFSLKEGTTKIFEKEIYEAWKKMPKQITENVLEIDTETTLDAVTAQNFFYLDKIEPSGKGNSKPIFLFKNLTIENIKAFGNGGIHLELTFKKSNGDLVRAIGFFMYKSLCSNYFDGTASALSVIKIKDTIDLVASFDKNYFNGKIEYRLKIIDLKIAH